MLKLSVSSPFPPLLPLVLCLALEEITAQCFVHFPLVSITPQTWPFLVFKQSASNPVSPNTILKHAFAEHQDSLRNTRISYSTGKEVEEMDPRVLSNMAVP